MTQYTLSVDDSQGKASRPGDQHRTDAARLSARVRRPSPASVDVPRVVNTGTNLFSSPERWSTDDVILDACSVDYLTLTTRSSASFQWAMESLSLYTTGEVKSQRQLQYIGVSGDGWFAGEAGQWDHELGIMRAHYMVRIWGSVAHRWLIAALGDKSTRHLEKFKCTRVDVQYTSPEQMPADFRLSELAPLFEAAQWPARPGPLPAVSSFRSPGGLDTLYIGTRKSGYRRLTRIYMKEVAERVLPRWETEYKEELASEVWGAILSDGLGILAGLLSREVASCPIAVICAELYARLRFSSSEQVHVKIRRARATVITTLRWLHNAVLPALRRLSADDDERVSLWVSGFLECAATCGTIEPPDPAGFSYEFYIAV